MHGLSAAPLFRTQLTDLQLTYRMHRSAFITLTLSPCPRTPGLASATQPMTSDHANDAPLAYNQPDLRYPLGGSQVLQAGRHGNEHRGPGKVMEGADAPTQRRLEWHRTGEVGESSHTERAQPRALSMPSHLHFACPRGRAGGPGPAWALQQLVPAPLPLHARDPLPLVML